MNLLKSACISSWTFVNSSKERPSCKARGMHQLEVWNATSYAGRGCTLEASLT